MVIDHAGFRPGGRATFVSAKVAKTMLAVVWTPASAGASSSGFLRDRDRPACRGERFGGMLSSYYHQPTQTHLLDFSHHTS